MTLILAALVSVLFVELLVRSGFLLTAAALFNTSSKASQVVTSRRISDHWKEKALLAYSGRLMLYTCKLGLVLALAAAGIWLIGWLASRLLGIPLLDFLATWQGILLCTVIGVAYAGIFYRHRGRPGNDNRAGSAAAAGQAGHDYSATDKMLHRVALASTAMREMSFDMEMAAGGKSTAAKTRQGEHVFVAGLARAGTTILMRSLYASGRYRSLTYRDMPFVLMPNLWRRVAGIGARQKAEQERAHGDGIAVNYDSPEALEEVFWKTYCGGDYLHADHLAPHRPDEKTRGRFVQYVDAIIRSGKSDGDVSYLSKNNNNILRLSGIAETFPNCHIIVPFRDPLQQALSLRRQHQRFVQDNQADQFAGEYMAWLAHHEFGATRRPFCFEAGALDKIEARDPQTLEHWLLLWTHVYRQLLSRAPERTLFLSYEKLCGEDRQSWTSLLRRLGLDKQWTQGADHSFRLSQSQIEEQVDEDTLAQARDVHGQLLNRCL